MDFEFEHINEYDFLFGNIDEPIEAREERLRYGNNFKALVSKHFKKDSLIFAIIEMVNINTQHNVDGEGETYIYSNFAPEKNKKLLVDYKRIIDKVKASKTAIAKFKDWYKFNSFVFLKSNEFPEIYSAKGSGWKLDGDLQKEPKRKDDYGNVDDRTFNEDYIKGYLKFYAQIIHEDLGFSKFPFYAIIVRPISVKSDSDFHQLGNLYLHFATTDEKNVDFYCRLINDFLYVWVKEKGGAVVKKIIQDTEMKIEINETEETESHYPVFWGDAKNKLNNEFGKSKILLREFFDKVFTEKNNIDKLKLRQQIITDELIPYLMSIESLAKVNKAGVKRIDEILKKLKGNAQHNKFTAIDDKNVNNFIKLLSRRSIALVCGCLFGKSMPEIHSFLTTQSFVVEHISKRTIYPYLNGYFIYCSDEQNANNEDITNEEFYARASEKEKEFLKKCASKIHAIINNECINDYNEKCVNDLRLVPNQNPK